MILPASYPVAPSMKLHADSLIRTYGPLNALDGLTLAVEAGVLVVAVVRMR